MSHVILGTCPEHGHAAVCGKTSAWQWCHSTLHRRAKSAVKPCNALCAAGQDTEPVSIPARLLSCIGKTLGAFKS